MLKYFLQGVVAKVYSLSSEVSVYFSLSLLVFIIKIRNKLQFFLLNCTQISIIEVKRKRRENLLEFSLNTTRHGMTCVLGMWHAFCQTGEMKGKLNFRFLLMWGTCVQNLSVSHSHSYIYLIFFTELIFKNIHRASVRRFTINVYKSSRKLAKIVRIRVAIKLFGIPLLLPQVFCSVSILPFRGERHHVNPKFWNHIPNL